MRSISYILNRYSKHLFYGYTVALILLSVLPINGESSAINNNYIVNVRLDYLVHFIIFLPWVFLVRQWNEISFRKNASQAVAWMLTSLVFAFVTESVQYFIPYRSFNINDLISNFGGVLLGVLLFFTGLVPFPAQK